MSGTILGALDSKLKRRGPCSAFEFEREASTLAQGATRYPGAVRRTARVPAGALLRTEPSRVPKVGSASEN